MSASLPEPPSHKLAAPTLPFSINVHWPVSKSTCRISRIFSYVPSLGPSLDHGTTHWLSCARHRSARTNSKMEKPLSGEQKHLEGPAGAGRTIPRVEGKAITQQSKSLASAISAWPFLVKVSLQKQASVTAVLSGALPCDTSEKIRWPQSGVVLPWQARCDIVNGRVASAGRRRGLCRVSARRGDAPTKQSRGGSADARGRGWRRTRRGRRRRYPKSNTTRSPVGSCVGFDIHCRTSRWKVWRWFSRGAESVGRFGREEWGWLCVLCVVCVVFTCSLPFNACGQMTKSVLDAPHSKLHNYTCWVPFPHPACSHSPLSTHAVG